MSNIPKLCPVLGLELGFAKKQPADFSISVDRINPKEGYNKNNIKIISNRANFLKKDATIQEMESILLYMRNSELNPAIK